MRHFSAFEWIVFCMAVLWTLYMINFAVRQFIATLYNPLTPTNLIALLQVLAVVGVWFLHWSSYHLLYLIPCSFIVAAIPYSFVEPGAWTRWESDRQVKAIIKENEANQ